MLKCKRCQKSVVCNKCRECVCRCLCAKTYGACGHPECIKGRKEHRKGAGVVITTPILMPQINYGTAILLGKQSSGRYANKYNFSFGHIDLDDFGCFRAAACRELEEEFKLFISMPQLPNYLYNITYPSGGIFYIVRGEILRPPVATLNHILATMDQDKDQAAHQREMSHLCWFNVYNGEPIGDAGPVEVTSEGETPQIGDSAAPIGAASGDFGHLSAFVRVYLPRFDTTIVPEII